MLEHAFKAETIGLVTRDEFVQKRDTIKERLEEEAKKQRLAREEQELQVWGLGRGALLVWAEEEGRGSKRSGQGGL